MLLYHLTGFITKSITKKFELLKNNNTMVGHSRDLEKVRDIDDFELKKLKLIKFYCIVLLGAFYFVCITNIISTWWLSTHGSMTQKPFTRFLIQAHKCFIEILLDLKLKLYCFEKVSQRHRSRVFNLLSARENQKAKDPYLFDSRRILYTIILRGINIIKRRIRQTSVTDYAVNRSSGTVVFILRFFFFLVCRE